MNQAGGLLRAGKQKAVNGNGRGFVGIGKAVRTAFIQPFVAAGDEMVHANMFQLQGAHRRASTISRVTTSQSRRQGWAILLRVRCLLLIRELLRVFVHGIHSSQGLELRVGDATHAVDPVGVYVSSQHMRASDNSLAPRVAWADSGSSAS